MRFPEKLLDDVDELVENREFPSRSEAIRTAVREMVNDSEDDSSKKPWYK